MLFQPVPSYICFVDINVIGFTSTSSRYYRVIKSSSFNCCDGSFIATLASLFTRSKLSSLNGPEVFSYLIQDKSLKHLILGGDPIHHQLLREKLDLSISSDHISFIELPFLDVNSFDYAEIGDSVNRLCPDLVWVMLGAPKQDYFMSNIIPYLDQGVLLGTGAALKFYIGEIQLPKFRLGPMKFIWFSRILSEPFKQITRIFFFLIALPTLFLRQLRSSFF